ncbi:MAG TPA: trigger factor, partial [Terriglobia bacterium]|nr:trigger factor [Terriglobia bacterium]
MESPTCKKELIIEVPEDAVARESEQITSHYARVARLPGFRPGRAPRSLVGKRFRDEIRSEVVQVLVPRYFEDKIRGENLLLVGEPRFEDLQVEDGQAIRAKATFEVYPQIELKEYRGLEVEEDSAEVTDAELAEAVERLRQREATFEVIEERAAADDDYVMVSYQGRDVSNPGAEPIEVKEGMVQVGGKGTVPAFSEHLRGTRPGDVREFMVDYPADFPNAKLAGHSVRYHVAVQGLKRKVVPAADDELAKTVSEFSSLEELRGRLRQDMEKAKRRRVEHAAQAKLLEKLEDAHEFPVPETLVESQVQRKLERMLSGLLARGVDPRETQMDWHKLRDGMRPEAERDVRGSLILERI